MADPSTVVSLWASITGLFTPTALFLFVNLVIGTIVITSRFTSHRKPPPQHDRDSPYLVRAPSLLDRVKSIDFSPYKFPQYRNPEEETRYFPPSTEPPPQHDHDSPHLVRAPSLLERLKSIDFSLYKYPQYRNPEEETPYFPTSTEPVHDSKSVDPYPPQLQRAPSLIERVRSFNFSSIYKSQPYPETEATEVIDNSVSEPVNPGPGSDPDHPSTRSKSESKKTAVKVRESVKKSASEKSMMVGEADEKPEAVERRRPETTRPFGDGDEGVDAKADDFINKFRKQLKLQRLDSLLRYKETLRGK